MKLKKLFKYLVFLIPVFFIALKSFAEGFVNCCEDGDFKKILEGEEKKLGSDKID